MSDERRDGEPEQRPVGRGLQSAERLKRKYKAQQPPLRECAKCDKPALGWTAGGPEQEIFLACEEHWGTESPTSGQSVEEGDQQ